MLLYSALLYSTLALLYSTYALHLPHLENPQILKTDHKTYLPAFYYRAITVPTVCPKFSSFSLFTQIMSFFVLVIVLVAKLRK
jgi:hypothetical protein